MSQHKLLTFDGHDDFAIPLLRSVETEALDLDIAGARCAVALGTEVGRLIPGTLFPSENTLDALWFNL